MIGNVMFAVEEVKTEKAPKAIGPYSQAVKAGQTLYLSGQLGIDPATGKMAGETIEAQTTQVLKNMEAILAAQNLSFEHVVRVEIFLKDLAHFATVNELYGKAFTTKIKPARQTVQVAKLPLDALIEISCIAFTP
jgi:2-iminobutanoate/2-iminopropanoate deaminase